MVEMPKEYQDGSKFFLGLKIDLSKYPLIPRVETEYWVSEAIKDINLKVNCQCLDLFSGSGCIGIAVLKKTVHPCDFGEINDDFLEQIKINLELNNIVSNRFSILKTNIFSNVEKKYDFILANPPYVAENRIKNVAQDVLAFEPKCALFSGKEGIDAIEGFLKDAKNHLNEKGVIFMECDPEQKEAINDMLRKNNYSDWKFCIDQFGLIRYVKINL